MQFLKNLPIIGDFPYLFKRCVNKPCAAYLISANACLTRTVYPQLVGWYPIAEYAEANHRGLGLPIPILAWGGGGGDYGKHSKKINNNLISGGYQRFRCSLPFVRNVGDSFQCYALPYRSRVSAVV
jgi:hypothetical protein